MFSWFWSEPTALPASTSSSESHAGAPDVSMVVVELPEQTEQDGPILDKPQTSENEISSCIKTSSDETIAEDEPPPPGEGFLRPLSPISLARSCSALNAALSHDAKTVSSALQTLSIEEVDINITKFERESRKLEELNKSSRLGRNAVKGQRNADFAVWLDCIRGKKQRVPAYVIDETFFLFKRCGIIPEKVLDAKLVRAALKVLGPAFAEYEVDAVEVWMRMTSSTPADIDELCAAVIRCTFEELQDAWDALAYKWPLNTPFLDYNFCMIQFAKKFTWIWPESFFADVPADYLDLHRDFYRDMLVNIEVELGRKLADDDKSLASSLVLDAEDNPFTRLHAFRTWLWCIQGKHETVPNDIVEQTRNWLIKMYPKSQASGEAWTPLYVRSVMHHVNYNYRDDVTEIWMRLTGGKGIVFTDEQENTFCAQFARLQVHWPQYKHLWPVGTPFLAHSDLLLRFCAGMPCEQKLRWLITPTPGLLVAVHNKFFNILSQHQDQGAADQFTSKAASELQKDHVPELFKSSNVTENESSTVQNDADAANDSEENRPDSNRVNGDDKLESMVYPSHPPIETCETKTDGTPDNIEPDDDVKKRTQTLLERKMKTDDLISSLLHGSLCNTHPVVHRDALLKSAITPKTPPLYASLPPPRVLAVLLGHTRPTPMNDMRIRVCLTDRDYRFDKDEDLKQEIGFRCKMFCDIAHEVSVYYLQALTEKISDHKSPGQANDFFAKIATFMNAQLDMLTKLDGRATMAARSLVQGKPCTFDQGCSIVDTVPFTLPTCKTLLEADGDTADLVQIEMRLRRDVALALHAAADRILPEKAALSATDVYGFESFSHPLESSYLRSSSHVLMQNLSDALKDPNTTGLRFALLEDAYCVVNGLIQGGRAHWYYG